jgi:hypothetical protein
MPRSEIGPGDKKSDDPFNRDERVRALSARVTRLEVLAGRAWVHSMQIWVGLAVGFSLGMAVFSFTRPRQDLSGRVGNLRHVPGEFAQTHPNPSPGGDGDAFRSPGASFHKSLLKAHFLEVLVGLIIGLIALAVTVFLFTRSR